MNTVYMDHAATTALSKEALTEMLPYFTEEYGNPSAVYSLGQNGKNALEKCRERCARCIGAMRSEIFFTSGGTESDSWVLQSAAKMKKEKGRHIITTEVEHNAVRKTAARLEDEGYEVTYLIPDENGQITPKMLEDTIRPDTILISVMTANNVVGTIFPIRELAKTARKHHVLFHTDAVQAVGHIPVNVREMGIDFLSVSAHKFQGPKGVGLLFARLPGKLPALIIGGGQEKDMRSGTENIPGIVGMTRALEVACADLPHSMAYLNRLRDQMIQEVLTIPGLTLTGDPVNRLPGFCSFAAEGISHSVLVVNEMNARGFAISSGSACSAASKEASHVLLALGYDKALASSSIRITLGMENTEEEAARCVAALRDSIEKVRTDSKTKAPRLEGRVKEYREARP